MSDVLAPEAVVPSSGYYTVLELALGLGVGEVSSVIPYLHLPTRSSAAYKRGHVGIRHGPCKGQNKRNDADGEQY